MVKKFLSKEVRELSRLYTCTVFIYYFMLNFQSRKIFFENWSYLGKDFQIKNTDIINFSDFY